MPPGAMGRMVAMDDVNLYIEVSTEQVRKCRRRYIYVLEYDLGDGIVRTETYSGVGEAVSLERTVLMAVARGIGRIRVPSEVWIYMGCRDVLAPLENGVYRKWEGNGFRSAKGGDIKNMDLWSQIVGLLERHLWHVIGHAEHPYKRRMEYDLKKMEERYGEKAVGTD